MKIIEELNGLSNKLEQAFENENWNSVDEVYEEINELIYRLSDGDLLESIFDE